MKSTSSVSLYGRYIVSGTVSSAWMHVAVQNSTSSNLHPFILSLQAKNRSRFYFQEKKRCKNADILYPDLHVPECECWRTVVTCPWPPHLVLLQWPSGGATTSCHVQHNTSPTINPGIPSHRHQAAAFCTSVRRQNILQDIVFLSISDNHKKYFIFIIYKCLMKLYGPSGLRS